jgi:Tfp pilus assembly protein PilO
VDDFKPSWDNLPGWLSAILIVLYVLRSHFKRGYEYLFKSADDTREHRQELETIKLDSALQDRAAQSLRQRELDNQALSILRESLDWSRREFTDMQHQMQAILHGLHRNNDMMTLHNKLIAELIEETKELIKSVKTATEKDTKETSE